MYKTIPTTVDFQAVGAEAPEQKDKLLHKQWPAYGTIFISWPSGPVTSWGAETGSDPVVCNHPIGEPRTTLGHIPKYVGV